MTKEQRTQGTTVTLLELPTAVSLDLSRRVLDLRESGLKLSKTKLIERYIMMGLRQDAPGQSEPIRHE